MGVDSMGGAIHDMTDLDVYEPLAVKEQIITTASEAASMLLRIDDVIASGRTAAAGPPGGPGGPGGPGEDGDFE